MRYDEDYESPDVIDRRDEEHGGGAGLTAGSGAIGLLLRLVASRFGFGGTVVLFVGYYLLQSLGGSISLPGTRRATTPTGPDPQRSFVAFALDDIQNFWRDAYPGPGGYQRAQLVLFRNRTPTACGLGAAATGPFYCPGDKKAYIDLSFFQTLSERLGAPGDFARAYVLAHEVGHHVQNLQGTSRRVHQAPSSRQKGAQGLSVRLELQADCFAGAWAHYAQKKGLLEAGDLEEALRAAQAIGDDTLQRNSSGTVRPETFSHGTSKQREQWFARGFRSGDPKVCDSFSGAI
ncbi:MAG: zinc metallopeptidase [Myxococcales bacterium]|nr:zinc metallopeptidase [Myxococcales bacterium]